MPNDGVLWEMQPHTEAKHAILKNYLNAWLPIMTSWNGRVVFLDGFAGPGRYTGGELGSPLIALEAALKHRQPIKSQVLFLFIEADLRRFQHLQGILDSVYQPRLAGTPFSYQAINGKFDNAMGRVLGELEESSLLLAPTFAFIDPFGYSDTPFTMIQRLMKQPRCEVLINFNYEELNRFLLLESQWPHFDQQFGTGQWRTGVALAGESRQQYLHDLYKTQLENGAGSGTSVLFR